MDDIARRYLRLLKQSLVNDLYIETEVRLAHCLTGLANGTPIELPTLADIRRDQLLFQSVDRAKEVGGTIMIGRVENGQLVELPALRRVTDVSHTMIGRKRLDNLEHCLERILADGVPGDLIETGVWRGGAIIFMRGFLAAHEVTDRIVWAADSFAGVPPPSLPEDQGYDFSAASAPGLAVDLDSVKALIDRYGLLDGQVRFLEGWFKDSLPGAPIERLALLRLDGDLYESTMDALNALYDRVSPGGFIIVDDYFSCPPCGVAIEAFRSRRAITDEKLRIDPQSIFWRKSA